MTSTKTPSDDARGSSSRVARWGLVGVLAVVLALTIVAFDTPPRGMITGTLLVDGVPRGGAVVSATVMKVYGAREPSLLAKLLRLVRGDPDEELTAMTASDGSYQLTDLRRGVAFVVVAEIDDCLPVSRKPTGRGTLCPGSRDLAYETAARVRVPLPLRPIGAAPRGAWEMCVLNRRDGADEWSSTHAWDITMGPGVPPRAAQTSNLIRVGSSVRVFAWRDAPDGVHLQIGTADAIDAGTTDVTLESELAGRAIVHLSSELGAGTATVFLGAPHGRKLGLPWDFLRLLTTPGKSLTVHGLPSGQWQVVAWPSGRGWGEGTVDHAVGAVTEVELEITD